MARLPVCSSRRIIDALIKDGFSVSDSPKRGSHQVLKKHLPTGRTLVTVVPLGKREIPVGTLVSILRQAGIDRDRFLRLI